MSGGSSVRDLPANTHLQEHKAIVELLAQGGTFNEPVLALWARVLRAVDRSRLVLLAPEGSARQRTAELLERAGVEPERVTFVGRQPRAPYLELHRRIDIGKALCSRGGSCPRRIRHQWMRVRRRLARFGPTSRRVFGGCLRPEGGPISVDAAAPRSPMHSYYILYVYI
jgi:hypothetical protein